VKGEVAAEGQPTAEGRGADAPLSARISRLLADRGLAEGDKAPTEAQLSMLFGASRQRVREALRHLEALGVLHARQGSGRVMAGRAGLTLPGLLSGEMPRNLDEILNLLAVRQVLEVWFLPAVVGATDGEHLALLRGVVGRMEDKAGRGLSFSPEDREFHQALYDPIHNPLLQSLLGRFWDLFAELDESEFHHTEHAAQTVQHHTDILNAIERRDVPLAQFHMNAHFYDVVKVVEDVAEREGWSPPVGLQLS